MSYSTVEQLITQLRAFPGYYVSEVSLEDTQDEDEETMLHISMKNTPKEQENTNHKLTSMVSC